MPGGVCCVYCQKFSREVPAAFSLRTGGLVVVDYSIFNPTRVIVVVLQAFADLTVNLVMVVLVP